MRNLVTAALALLIAGCSAGTGAAGAAGAQSEISEAAQAARTQEHVREQLKAADEAAAKQRSDAEAQTQ
jgi:hypothetical protein